MTRELFAFLEELAVFNNREWFQANKPRYQQHVKAPLLSFTRDFQAPLARISKQFVADPRPVGGSMFRIYRDVRFSKDKRPYKTHASLQFRHRVGKDVHAPGFYLHLEPGSCFCGGGIYRPDGETVRAIRRGIIERPTAWKRIAGDDKPWRFGGDALKRAPRGVDPEHPLLGDLRRKDFIAIFDFDDEQVLQPEFADNLASVFSSMAPLLRFLCKATGVGF
ncbi:MAG: DUF2461 domain-containing protein [Deltaproteobacteria bacterium]|nr:DUF2461 domain-containing protein [Deltaproteobacteria bacterium]